MLDDLGFKSYETRPRQYKNLTLQTQISKIFSTIMKHSDTRRIFLFFLINLSFMFVEFLYSILSDSLTLLSDSFHMLFDCISLFAGLFASYVSKLPRNSNYTYGYSRIEPLSGFANSIFLVCVGLLILRESIERLIISVTVKTERLFVVSIIGLVINLIGMYLFRDRTAETKKPSKAKKNPNESNNDVESGKFSGDNGDQFNKRSGDNDSTSIDIKNYVNFDRHMIQNKEIEKVKEKNKKVVNDNLEGIWFHVLSDTLGSVVVIISTIFIDNLQWYWVDSFCSLILSLVIIVSVLPLLIRTFRLLAHKQDPALNANIQNTINKLILKYHCSIVDYKSWVIANNEMVITIHLSAQKNSKKEQIIQLIKQSLQNEYQVKKENITIQIQYFDSHLQNLSNNFNSTTYQYDSNVNSNNKINNNYFNNKNQQNQINSLIFRKLPQKQFTNIGVSVNNHLENWI
ncbi:zinc transporter [Anaeramoeba flamelloides]|uniref:Zinc transporter n=1 Tax=Anaeramoeba flamelloides TaxID=1746091 RepID=A0AAV7Z9B5_9EUKA|nr:zinc transporter [Anaeramoeba flamelloides]